MVDVAVMHEKIRVVESKRDALVRLLEQPDIGTLRIDVNQALEELDDLIDEFKQTFPDNQNSNN